MKSAYTAEEAAAEVGAAKTRIRDAVYSGEIPVVYVSSKRWVIRHEALMAWLDSLPAEKSA